MKSKRTKMRITSLICMILPIIFTLLHLPSFALPLRIPELNTVYYNSDFGINSSEISYSKNKILNLNLQEDYFSGLRVDHNQQAQISYEIKTFDDFDYFVVSFGSSFTVNLESYESITYYHDDEEQNLSVCFKSTQDSLDNDLLVIDNINQGKIYMFLSVYIDNDLVQYNEYEICIYITPYGDFITAYDNNTTKGLYYKWLYENEIIAGAEYKKLYGDLFLGVEITDYENSPNPIIQAYEKETIKYGSLDGNIINISKEKGSNFFNNGVSFMEDFFKNTLINTTLNTKAI